MKNWTLPYQKIESAYADLKVLFDFMKSGDASEEEVESHYQTLLKEMDELEFKNMLSGEEDVLPAVVNINSGAGGTESCDWAEMLMRMYIRWGERNGYKVT